jgi:hypothetical protein
MIAGQESEVSFAVFLQVFMKLDMWASSKTGASGKTYTACGMRLP